MLSSMELDFEKEAPKPDTLEECHLVIEALWEFCRALKQEVIELKQEVTLLRQENAELKEKLNLNSNNSSKPPSQDLKKKKKKKQNNGIGRKPGGQPGHVGISRKLVPPEQVDKVVTCPPPDKCNECDVPLLPLSEVVRHQVYEVPLPRYEITEYQLLQGYCSCCQKTYSGQTPAEVGKRGFGVRTHAMIALLTSKFKLSKRQALTLLKDFFQMPICVGSVSNIEHRVSQALEPLHEQIKNRIDGSKIAHIDETGFKQNNRSGWAWVMANECFSFFKLEYSRGKKVAKQLIGNFINRIIISDRYPAYNFLPTSCHQICWAHLKRDFQKISERSRIAGVIGRRLLHQYGKIFAFWKSSLQQGYNDDKRTQKKRRRLKNGLIKILQFGARCSHPATARTCCNILEAGEGLWLFLEDPDVPATNNLAERQIRPLVIAKKISFGVKSERGARFIERIYSLVLTCQQQNKNVLSWLQDSIIQYFTGNSAPILV